MQTKMTFSELKKLIEECKEDQFVNNIGSTAFNLLERDNEYGCSLLDWAAICNRSAISIG